MLSNDIEFEFTLSLIRHGQSTTNVNPDLMGQLAETPLTDHGRWQAGRLNDRLKKTYGITHVFSSPYTRALDTAKIATQNMFVPYGIVLADDLREYDAGEWTGVSRKEALTLPIQNRMGHLNHFFLPPSGESLNQVQRRAAKWLEENILYNKELQLCNENLANGGIEAPHILCFSHGMTIKCLLQYILGFDKGMTWKVMIENTSISTLSFGKDGWRLLGINDHSHLT